MPTVFGHCPIDSLVFAEAADLFKLIEFWVARGDAYDWITGSGRFGTSDGSVYIVVIR